MNDAKSSDLTHEFEEIVASLSDVFGKEYTDIWIEHWRHGESTLALENLINNLTEIEPSLTKEMQERIASLAQHNKDLLAEFREVYPELD
jgi:acyl carrier protein phosphodiesterase